MRTHSSRFLMIFVRDEKGGLRGLLLVPSCCSLIQPGRNSKHLDQQTISDSFFLMLWSLKDLCSSCDTHAPHKLIDRSTQLRHGIFSCVRRFLPLPQK